MRTGINLKHTTIRMLLFLVSNFCIGFHVYAQTSNDAVVTGVVIEEDTNEPLPGVQVWIKDSSYGAITDVNGRYTLKYQGKFAVLCASFLGYETEEQSLSKDKKQTVNFKMRVANEQIDEVVVVGHGTQKKVSVIGAISSVSPNELKAPVAKVSSMLAGQLAGIIAYQRSGEPGTGSSFWIRGVSSFSGSTTPLILVDGIERDLDLVDPEDIKEFSILKDASATAVYGVRGANGVVLITTRQGEEGKASIQARVEMGVVSPTKVPEMANAAQFTEMYNDAVGYKYYSDEAIAAYKNGSDPDIYPNVDWMDAIFKDLTFNQRANISVSGGTSVVKYYISGSTYGEDGLFKQDNAKAYNTAMNYRKFNFRSNVDIKVEKNTTLNVNLSTIFERKNSSGNDTGDIFYYALKTPAVAFPIKYSTGEYAGPGSGQGYNAYAMVTESGYKQSFWNTAQTLLGLDHDFGWILPGLKGSVKYSFDARNNHNQNRTRTPEQYGQAYRDEDGNLVITQLVQGSQTLSFSQSSYGWRRNYLEASLNYAQKFGRHSVSALALFQQSSLNYVGSSATSSNAALPYRNQGLAGRLTYDYDSRYFFEFNIGYNGSENFSPGHRFGVFPAFAGGWLISEENFWSGLKSTIDMLKLKTSWGKVGNDDIGGSRRFIYLETVSDGSSYSFGTNAGSQSSLVIGDPGNANVGWEEAKKLDLGVDLSLFNKLKIQFDYFSEHRTGIFLQRKAIPVFVGLSTNPWVNIGKMDNKGFDGSADYNQKIGKVNLTAKGTFTFARNQILDMDQPDWAELYMNQTGQASGQTIGYVSDGLFESWEDIYSHADQSLFSPQPGDIKYVDLNNDGVIDSKDVKPIGWRTSPEIVYGFGLQAQWNGFDFSVFFQGTGHTSFFYNSTMVTPFTSTNINQANVLADIYGNYWTEENTNSKYPRLTAGSNTNNSQTSDFWLANGRFLRLKNAEIGYSLPKRIISRAGISGARFYLQGTNLLTFSPFKLWDPELVNNSTNYPATRVISVGLSFGF